jgi:tetratricopeptide (TPR) repeat protein
MPSAMRPSGMAIERGPRPAATHSRLASGLPQAAGSAILRAEDRNGAAMRNLLIVIATLLGLAGPAWADWRSELNARIAAYNSGDLDTAIADYTKATQLKPNLAGAYNRRGLAYFAKGLRDQAIADYTKTIELKPDYAEAYFSRGNAYRGKKLDDQAIADYPKPIGLKPDYAYAYYHPGLEYEKLGQRDNAIADYRQALSLDPGMKEAQDGLKRLGVN